MPNLVDKLKALISSEEKVVLKSVDEEQRLFLGVVLEPEVYDLHSDIYSAEAIRKACGNEQQYLQSNVQHTTQVDDSVMTVTKSFIQEVDAVIGEKVIKAGTWLREAFIKSDYVWDKVRDGTYNGWSVGCRASCDDVPLDCIKSAEDLEKSTWDRNKFQRLDDFNFSAPGAHVALVSGAANGWEGLVIKSAESPQDAPSGADKELLKRLDIESISKQDGGEELMVSMPLSKLLQIAFMAWEEDADTVAASVVKSAEADGFTDEVTGLVNGLLGSPSGATLSGTSSGRPAPQVAKSNGENPKMSDEKVEVMKQADVEAMINKALETQKSEFESEIQKRDKRLESFEKAEDARKTIKFEAMEEGYKALGNVEGLGEVLKSLEATEGFDKVLALLDSAKETISKSVTFR